MLTKKQADEYINCIPFDRYISRPELGSVWGTKDRETRDIVSQLRKMGAKYVVISSSSHSGYKRPSKYEEVQKCVDELDSRIKELSRIKKYMTKLLKDKDQLGLGIAL